MLPGTVLRVAAMTARCLIVAETSLNHNGSVETAHQMIDAIAEAGADAAKFQCYRTSDFVTDPALTYQGRSQVEMFDAYQLPDEAWPELQAHCREAGLMFFATPTSEERLELLVGLGVPMLKNGSDYLGHLPLIRAMARTGIPTVLSTGMATEEEIRAATDAFEETVLELKSDFKDDDSELTLMHCTSTYPTQPSDVNLCRMVALKEWCWPVGLSDHTVGTIAAGGAVALGASMVEKHFTLDRDAAGPDHHFSADPDDLALVVDVIRTTEEMLGSPELEPTESEQESRRFRVVERDGEWLRR